MVAVAPFRPTILPLSRRKVSSQSACRRKEQVDEVWLKRRRGSWCAEYCGRLGEPAQHGSILAAVPRIAFGRSLGGRVRAFGSQVHIGAAHRTPTVRSRGCCSRGHIVLAARTHGKGEVHSNAHELATWMLCAGKAELLHPRTWVRAAGRHFAWTCAQLCRAFTPRDEITESAALTAPAAATWQVGRSCLGAAPINTGKTNCALAAIVLVLNLPERNEMSVATDRLRATEPLAILVIGYWLEP
mmetsp:Transcript_19308/g.60733  ORF Transcript_19308/g.60733 Transcript_19308/m.60733 type:complete len:243 (-) Transcript_19308:143-871(-)